MQAKSGAIRSFLEIQVADARCDIAGIDEERGVDVRHHRDARFSVDDEEIAVVEAIVVVATQRVLAAEAGLQIERYVPPFTGGGAKQPSIQCQHDTSAGERN